MATLDDIAQLAGVSRSSVARILRDEPGFNIHTRERVRRAARELNYRPNYLGRALAGGKTHSIGILFSGIQVPATALQVAGIQRAALQHGYLPYVLDPGFERLQSADADVIQELADRRVDGVILQTLVPAPAGVLKNLQKLIMPVVTFGRHVLPEMPGVHLCQRQAFADLAEHLAALGHRRVGLFFSRSDLAHPHLKIESYRAALAARGIELKAPPEWCLDPEVGRKRSAYQFTRRLLQEPAKHQVTCLITNDDCAHPVIAAAADLGKEVPRDLSLCGFDDLPHTQYLRPALTTIRKPREEMGVAAFELLLRCMNASEPLDPAAPSIERLACRFIARDSTGPVP